MARRDTSPRPVLRPEGFGAAEQTERMLQPEGDPVAPTEVLKTGITKEVMDKAQEYVSNPPPPKQQSPVQKAIDKSLIGGAEEDYEVKVSKVTPEGRGAIEGMISRVLGKEFDGDLDAFYYCTTFVSDMLDSIGADPLDDKGDKYNRTRANAYMKYGTPVDIEDIQEGDIVIFDFPKLPDGTLTLDPTRGKRNGLGDHATFYAGDRLDVNKPGSNYIGVLGGEQGGGAAISMKAFDKSHILGVRRIQYNDIDYEFTKELAKVNPDFNKFLNNEAKAFDFNAFMEQSSNPIQGTNRLTSGFDKGGLTEQTDSMLPAVDDDTRSTEEYLEDTKPMDISSVPAFQRPMDASENDKPTGNIDETGAIEYRTALGNTYLVRRNPDQRTTRTKIEEDVLPAVREYLADPTAPTADQAIAAAKAIAGDAWETISIPGDLLSGEKGASDVTLGEVFELTGGTAAASTMFDVPGGRDTLRIFGGARAKYPPNMTGYGSIDSTFNAEADFKTLENLSVDFENDPTGSLVRIMDELERNPSKYPATLKEVVAGNWFRGRDDLMRFEIDDSQSEILGNGVGDIVRMDEDDMDAYLRGFSFDVDNKFPDNSIQGMPEEQAFSTLGNILKHDQLYNQYPQLRDAPVIEDTAYFKRNPSVLGYFDDSSGTIAINTNKIKTNEELRDTLLHEVQHLVQHLEGFESGTNVRNADVLEIKKAIEGSPEYQKAFVDYNAKVSKYLENRDSATVAVYNKNREVASKVLDIILDDFSNKTQIPVEEIYERLNKGETFDSIKMSVSPDIRARGFVYPPEFEQILHIAEGNVGGMAPSSSIDLNRSLDDVNPRESAAPYFEMLSGKDKIDLVADNNRWQQNRLSSTISSLIKDNPELAKDFENSLGFSAQDFIDASRSQDSVGKLYGIPNVVPPTKPKIVRNYVIYSTKRGEVEARNVSARKDMTASERTPENVFDTEDTPANRQWGEPEVQKARAGQNPVTGFANGPSASEPSPVKGFKTGRGSTYKVEEGSRTTRERAPDEVGGEVVTQPTSGKTIYMSYDDMEKFGLLFQKGERGLYQFVPIEGQKGKAHLTFAKDYGPNKAGDPVPNTEVSFTTEPRVGDHPVEIYESTNNNRVSIHFGSEITEVFDDKKSRQFAEGGAVGNMNQQMSFAFEDGGLRDDGMMRDPVSGNEVPPGSTAKEVRDDIPAQLSEGEYVVPADVVRYYGVKFFEDLRDNAKMGLQDMEARGRIGGEPVPAGGPMNDDDLSPEELAAIQEMMGMAEGGVVNMYKQQQDLYSPPNPAIGNPTTTGMASGGEVRGYNSSSVVTNPMTDQSVLEAGQQAQQRGFVGFPLGATIFPSATTGQTVVGPSGTQVATTGNIGQATTGTTGTTTTTDTSALTTVTLYGPNGEIITLTLPTDTDRYKKLLSEGWTTEMPVAGSDRDSATGTKTGPDTDPSSWMDNFDYNDFDKLKDQTSENLTRIPFGGVIGTLSNATKAAQSAANIIVMKANGFDTADLEKELNKFKKENGLNLLPNEFINGDRLALDIIRNNPGADLGIDKKATDLEGNFIFKSKGAWDDFMQEIAPPNMTYNPATESYVSDGSSGGNGATLIETLPSGVKVYQPGPDTLRPFGRTASTVDSGPSTQSEKTAAAKSAANDWVAATQAVQSTSTDDPKAWSDAIKAQSEASKAATKAIKEASGWGTDNYNPNWRDAAEGGLMTTEKPKKKTRKYNKGGLAGKK